MYLYRAIVCKSTRMYGRNGATFADFGTNRCGVDIKQITIRHGSIIDAVQVIYKSETKNQILKPRRGGRGGRVSKIVLQNGERITGAIGMACRNYITQLIFFSEGEDGQRKVYGPYGAASQSNCKVFAVNGKINSIFGKLPKRGFPGLGAIGFYYEDESKGKQSSI